MTVVAQNQTPSQYFGVAADTKPTTGVPAGSTFYATDTGVTYVYDGSSWGALPGLSSLPASLGQKTAAQSTSVVQAIPETAFAYEQLTVAASSVGLTFGTYADATKATLRLETGQIRFRVDGVAVPTASVGTLLEIGETLELAGAAAIAAFHAIRTGATSGLLSCTYSKAS